VILQAFSFLYGVEAVLFVVGLILCVYRVVSGPATARRPVGLLLLWLIVPVVMLGTRKTALWWYYFDLLYPSQFIIAGMAVSALTIPRIAPPGVRRILAGAAVGIVVSIVAVQTWFLVGMQRRIDSAAEIVLDVPRLSVAAAPSALGTLSFLPYGYRIRILRALLEDFRMPGDAFPERVHGPVLGLPEENEYLVRHLAARTHSSTAGGSAAHYLVSKDPGAVIPPSVFRSARVGPYVIAEYEPTIDYRHWSHAWLPRRDGDRVGEGSWQRRELPAADVSPPGEGLVLAWRGGLHVPNPPRPVKLTVSVIAEAPLELYRLDNGGRLLDALIRRSWQSPSLYSTTDAVLDVSDGYTSGHQPVGFAVVGRGRLMRVDVYERGDP
jgi:multisubunit Na+/H+ antiporter MnhF subunit